MPPTRWTVLPSLVAVAVTGRDAPSFLQGQVTNDLLGLERHPGLLTAACNRSGRVLEVMRLATSADGILLIMPASLAPACIARLSAFVLRAEVSLAIRGDELVIAGLLDAEPDPSWTPASAAAAGLTMMVASPRRILLAGSRPVLERALHVIDQATPGEWDRACIEDGEPVIHPQTAGLWVPQMLNLDLLAAVSFTKGCYVGQEIVARTQHLGQIKRRMLRYAGPAGLALQAGDTLYAGDSLAAQVVTALDNPRGSQLLAVVGLQYCSELLGCRPGGTELVPADLPYAIPALDAEAGT